MRGYVMGYFHDVVGGASRMVDGFYNAFARTSDLRMTLTLMDGEMCRCGGRSTRAASWSVKAE